METISWPIGEYYVRGDTLPSVSVEVAPDLPDLVVASARLQFKPHVAAKPVLSFSSEAGAENAITITALEGEEPGQLLTLPEVSFAPFYAGRYTADLEVVFTNGFRKTLFRAELIVEEDYTR